MLLTVLKTTSLNIQVAALLLLYDAIILFFLLFFQLLVKLKDKLLPKVITGLSSTLNLRAGIIKLVNALFKSTVHICDLIVVVVHVSLLDEVLKLLVMGFLNLQLFIGLNLKHWLRLLWVDGDVEVDGVY